MENHGILIACRVPLFRTVPATAFGHLLARMASHALRDLRNEAAHCYFEFSFEDPGVIKHLKKLEQYDLEMNRKVFLGMGGIRAAGTSAAKFDFIVLCYAVLMELQGALLREGERYAIEVRGIPREALVSDKAWKEYQSRRQGANATPKSATPKSA
jgi:hypothetical protein